MIRVIAALCLLSSPASGADPTPPPWVVTFANPLASASAAVVCVRRGPNALECVSLETYIAAYDKAVADEAAKVKAQADLEESWGKGATDL
jgi:hypothetical protein